jgi:hypothetical protein
MRGTPPSDEEGNTTWGRNQIHGGFDGGFDGHHNEDLDALGEDILGEDEGDMMMLGQDDDDEVEVVTS